MEKILIVDDDEMMRTLAVFWLKKGGFQCLEAINGDEARKIAFEEQPNLIVMDCYLARESGVELTKILKTDSRSAHIPILALTADPYMQNAFAAAGADGYLIKPIQQQKFLVKVTSLLQTAKIS